MNIWHSCVSIDPRIAQNLKIVVWQVHVKWKRCITTWWRRRRNIFLQVIREKNTTTALDSKQANANLIIIKCASHYSVETLPSGVAAASYQRRLTHTGLFDGLARDSHVACSALTPQHRDVQWKCQYRCILSLRIWTYVDAFKCLLLLFSTLACSFSRAFKSTP